MSSAAALSLFCSGPLPPPPPRPVLVLLPPIPVSRQRAVPTTVVAVAAAAATTAVAAPKAVRPPDQHAHNGSYYYRNSFRERGSLAKLIPTEVLNLTQRVMTPSTVACRSAVSLCRCPKAWTTAETRPSRRRRGLRRRRRRRRCCRERSRRAAARSYRTGSPCRAPCSSAQSLRRSFAS